MILVWFDIAVTFSGLLIGGLFVTRNWGQHQLDTGHATYHLTFPRELKHDDAALLFTSLRGLYRPVRRVGEPFGRNTIAFEVLATHTGIHYLISFPPNVADIVRGHLSGVIPGIRVEEVAQQPRRWNYAIELARRDVIVEDEHGAFKEIHPDPRLVPVLLRSMTDLHENEAVIVQFVMTPIGNVIDPKQDSAFWVVGRLAASGNDIRAKALIKRTLSAYSGLQVFQARKLRTEWTTRVNNRSAPTIRWPGQLKAHALAVVCALPIGTPQVPGLALGQSRRLAAGRDMPRDGIRVGVSNYPGDTRDLTMSVDALTRHMHVLGATATGKTTVLENLFLQTVQSGSGGVFIDPHGDAANNIVDRIPHHRLNDVVWFNPADSSRSISLNVFAGDPYIVMDQILAVFDKLYDIHRLPQTADVLRSSVLTLAQAGMTLMDIPALLGVDAASNTFRHRLTKDLDDPALKNFWQWYNGQSPNRQLDVTAPVLRRLRAFEVRPNLRACLGQAGRGLDLEAIIRQRKILIVSLSKGQLGDETSRLFGALLVAKVLQAAQGRSAIPVHERSPFAVFIDEFQNYVSTPTNFADVLAESRKYGVGFVLAHQYMSQLSPNIRDSIMPNTRSKIVFPCSAADALVIARELACELTAADFQTLEKFEVVVKLDGGVAATARTFPPTPSLGTRQTAIEKSNSRYGRSIDEVLGDQRKRQGQTATTAAPEVAW
ncbi:type IV secretion system DNA-binding domain-containing protein [Streptomyces sp. RKAG293]|uniref:type IV secretory system conjugative DNA transfer family protein n=1 Tax=Streptomyces sp. RKAG293 TaxID=2893403 RepID=UPI002033B22A|nr:type IV secretion system DNA-binding domain-containing protein [Streptomyces sp. RKAG293]MCM2417677.1 type IV secretion system DNA-binding domain-containing protein [Streptomyces sp. RKAG293]